MFDTVMNITFRIGTITWTSFARPRAHWEQYVGCQGCQGVLSPICRPLWVFPTVWKAFSSTLSLCEPCRSSQLYVLFGALNSSLPPRECFRGQINNSMIRSTAHWGKGGRSKRMQRMMKGSKTESWEHEYQGKGHFPPAPLLALAFPPLDTSLKLLQLCQVEDCADK